MSGSTDPGWMKQLADIREYIEREKRVKTMFPPIAKPPAFDVESYFGMSGGQLRRLKFLLDKQGRTLDDLLEALDAIQ